MALEIGVKNYEPNWNLDKATCYDLDNSELKKKYGENVRYLCCGNTFNKAFSGRIAPFLFGRSVKA